MKKKKLKVVYKSGKIREFVIRKDSEGFIFTVGSLRNPKIIPSVNMMKQLQDAVTEAFKNPPFTIFLPAFVKVKKIKFMQKENNEEKKTN